MRIKDLFKLALFNITDKETLLFQATYHLLEDKTGIMLSEGKRKTLVHRMDGQIKFKDISPTVPLYGMKTPCIVHLHGSREEAFQSAVDSNHTYAGSID